MTDAPRALLDPEVTPTLIPKEELNPEKAPATVLMGPPGSGKTWALTSYIEEGLDLCVLVTDAGGVTALRRAMYHRGLDPKRLHYRYIAPATPSWTSLKAIARRINDMTYADLAKDKGGIEKKSYQQFYEMLSALENFTCDHCGGQFGAVDTWGPDDMAFGFDGMSGLNIMCLRMMIGGKPTAHEGEWGVSMGVEEQFIQKFTDDLNCFRCMTAHVEKEPNIVTGIPTTTMAALGRRLAPKLPRSFDDIVFTRREGTEFHWSTMEAGADTKASNLPLSATLKPSFKDLITNWRKACEYLNREPAPPSPPQPEAITVST